MRNAEFNREAVLRSAMTAFMAKGYGKTSMQDLKKATGLHPGSIYCAFENKRGLLLAAIGQYNQDRSAEFAAYFVGEQPVLTKLKLYLDDIVDQCLSCEATQACLSVKALNEVAEQDEEIQQVITDNLVNWQAALASIFDQAKESGELISKQDSTHLSRYFTMGIYGLRTFAYTHPEADTLRKLADQLFLDTCRAS